MAKLKGAESVRSFRSTATLRRYFQKAIIQCARYLERKWYKIYAVLSGDTGRKENDHGKFAGY